MLACLASPKIQIILLLLFAWGELIKSDQNQTGQTSFKHLEHGKGENSPKLAQGMKALNTKRKEKKGNSTLKTKGGPKPFQAMPVVFLIELVLVLVGNLCTWMIRNYKNSIPFLRLNMIILVYHYLVEIGNIALTFQVKKYLVQLGPPINIYVTVTNIDLESPLSRLLSGLYLLYINDWPLATFFTSLFADDSSYLKSSPDIASLMHLMQTLN